MKMKRAIACLMVVLLAAGLLIPTVSAEDRTMHISNADGL